MGRLDEADEEYRAIEAICSDPVDLAKAAAVQVRGLTHARRLPEAIALGLDVLAQLGIAVPTTDGMLAELDQRLRTCCGGLMPPDPTMTWLATNSPIPRCLPARG